MTSWFLKLAHNIIYVLFTNIIKIGFTYDGLKKVCLCLRIEYITLILSLKVMTIDSWMFVISTSNCLIYSCVNQDRTYYHTIKDR